MKKSVVQIPWKLIAVVAWLVFTLALAGWWLVLGMRQAEQISSLRNESVGELVRIHRMLVWEGGTLLVMLLAGGLSLLYFTIAEAKRSKQVREFFAAFTHDLRTALTSLRLQAETLQEDLQDAAPARVVERLVKDTVRLELQLENSLFLARPDSDSEFLYEDLSLQQMISGVSHHWPHLKISVAQDAILHADRRALESIFKNLIQNAVIHGKATQMQISARASGEQCILEFKDDGKGFAGSIENLGRIFERHSPSSGSGIGLHLVGILSRRMQGQACFRPGVPQGFVAEVHLQGKIS